MRNGLHSWSTPGFVAPLPGQTDEESYWTVLSDQPLLAAGFVTGLHNVGRFTLTAEPERLRVQAWGECDGCVLRAGATRVSDELFISGDGDPMGQMERYGDLCAQANAAEIRHPNAATWCSWYAGWIRSGMHAHRGGLEAGVRANIPLVAREFGARRAAGMRIVDDSDEMPYGDWDDRTLALPSGFSAMVRAMQSRGVVPGIWLPPYYVAEKTRLYRGHPEWLARAADGSVAMRDFYGNRCATLDTSAPGAAQHLEDVARSLRQRGFRYVMTDFLVDSYGAPTLRDPAMTKTEMHRLGLEALRRGFGPNVYWLGCGAVLGPSQGLVDGMRISGDSFGDQPWSYLGAGTRWFYHRKLWLNDPDAIVCRGKSVEWNRAWMSWMALSGSVLTYGDTLDDLPAEQLEDYKRIFPPLDIAGRPLDLLENDPYLLWGVHVGQGSAAGKLFGVFHFDPAEGETVRLNLDEVWARIDGYAKPRTAPTRYLLWDFWGEELLESDGPRLEVPLPDRSGRLFALRPYEGWPQLLGTSGHFSQGAVEVSGMRWQPGRRSLRAQVMGNGGDPTRVFFHVPEGFRCADVTLGGEAATPRFCAPRVLAVSVPATAKPVALELRFRGSAAPTANRPFVSGRAATWDRSQARRAALSQRAPAGHRLVAYLDLPRDREDGKPGAPSLRLVRGQSYLFDAPRGVPRYYASIVFDADRIAVDLHGLEPAKRYRIGLSWWDHNNDGRVESVTAVDPQGGRHGVLDRARLPAYAGLNQLPEERLLSLPPEAHREGRCALEVSNEANVPNAVLSEVWLYEVE